MLAMECRPRLPVNIECMIVIGRYTPSMAVALACAILTALNHHGVLRMNERALYLCLFILPAIRKVGTSDNSGKRRNSVLAV